MFYENFWREGQGSERTDLKNNGFFIAVISRVSVLCRRIFVYIWHIYMKSPDAS